MAISRVPLTGINITLVSGDAFTSMEFSWGNSNDPVEVGDIIFLTGMQKGGTNTTDIEASINSTAGTAMEKLDLTGTDWPADIGGKRYYFAYYHKVVSADIVNGIVAPVVHSLVNGRKYHASIEIWRGVNLNEFDGNNSNQALNALPSTHAEDGSVDLVVEFRDYSAITGATNIWANSSVYSTGNCTALAFATADRAGNWDATTWVGGQDVIGNTLPEHDGKGCSTVIGYRDFTSLSDALADTGNGLSTPWSMTGVAGSVNGTATVRDSSWWILLPELSTGSTIAVTASATLEQVSASATLSSSQTRSISASTSLNEMTASATLDSSQVRAVTASTSFDEMSASATLSSSQVRAVTPSADLEQVTVSATLSSSQVRAVTPSTSLDEVTSTATLSSSQTRTLSASASLDEVTSTATIASSQTRTVGASATLNEVTSTATLSSSQTSPLSASTSLDEMSVSATLDSSQVRTVTPSATLEQVTVSATLGASQVRSVSASASLSTITVSATLSTSAVQTVNATATLEQVAVSATAEASQTRVLSPTASIEQVSVSATAVSGQTRSLTASASLDELGCNASLTAGQVVSTTASATIETLSVSATLDSSQVRSVNATATVVPLTASASLTADQVRTVSASATLVAISASASIITSGVTDISNVSVQLNTITVTGSATASQVRALSASVTLSESSVQTPTTSASQTRAMSVSASIEVLSVTTPSLTVTKILNATATLSEVSVSATATGSQVRSLSSSVSIEPVTANASLRSIGVRVLTVSENLNELSVTASLISFGVTTIDSSVTLVEVSTGFTSVTTADILISVTIDGLGDIEGTPLKRSEIMSLEEVWNTGLTQLGVATVDSATSDQTAQASLLRKVWSNFRKQFISDHAWNGCKTTVGLTKLPNSDFKDTTRWGNVFSLPTDYVRALTVNGHPNQAGNAEQIKWEIEVVSDLSGNKSRCICSNQSTAKLEYVFDPGDENIGVFLAPAMKHAMGLAFAAFVAPNFGKSANDIALIEQKAREAILKAKGIDGQESSGIYFGPSELVESRYRRL